MLHELNRFKFQLTKSGIHSVSTEAFCNKKKRKIVSTSGQNYFFILYEIVKLIIQLICYKLISVLQLKLFQSAPKLKVEIKQNNYSNYLITNEPYQIMNEPKTSITAQEIHARKLKVYFKMSS